MLSTLDTPPISTALRPTTQLLLGGLTFNLLSTFLLTPRISLLLTTTLLFLRFIPTLLVAAGKLPNDELDAVVRGKRTVVFPSSETHNDNGDGENKTTLSPSNKGLTVLILGTRISHPLGILAPGVAETGHFFTSLLADLDAERDAGVSDNGWLGGSLVTGTPTTPGGNPGHLSVIGYFRSVEDLHAFAQGKAHREAWTWWNRNAGKMPHLGVYHEIYDVPAKHWEAVYLQTPRLGLGATKVRGGDGVLRNVGLEDAGRGVWKTSSGRMGRGGEGEGEEGM
ncbi:hypothetical protein BU24DRAFT_497613 [Aaosphaeria arxii CBS 175.79]|uniref:Uncharacterized protein n=1 Tax=Aaosphaeria arxii CBS 175.79 TaxID=1450172 RepID=A0A6A5X836_9PLEO|nr:uncharacterized protein BU24DRAFT_497613 [Aaosphaeria arxii CBS 175.79]KAF2009059.1 hypothetical protein BU24DRAFT_497613 [Aaosphaeria arxii CBS 175.79]